MAAAASAIGPAYITPSIPIKIGKIIISGSRNNICLVSDINTPSLDLPIELKKFDVTDIGEQHDLMYIFQKPEKSKLQSKSVETKENETKGKTPLSRKQIKNNAKIITQKNTVSKEKQTDKLR